jgi:hypothetical protein
VPLDLRACSRQIDEIVAKVRATTERRAPGYEEDQSRFRHSWAHFRTLALVSALQRDCGIRRTDRDNDFPARSDTAPNDNNVTNLEQRGWLSTLRRAG